MSLFGQLIAWVLGEAVSLGAEPVLSRMWRDVKRRVRVRHLLLSWPLAIGAMVLAWKYGVGRPETWVTPILAIVFIVAPIVALLLTIAWMERRGA
jgi:hypothetical protein